jgi:hypothetical protein
MEVSGQASGSYSFTPWETAPGAYLMGWVGPRAGLDVMENGKKISCSRRGSNTYFLVIDERVHM